MIVSKITFSQEVLLFEIYLEIKIWEIRIWEGGPHLYFLKDHTFKWTKAQRYEQKQKDKYDKGIKNYKRHICISFLIVKNLTAWTFE